MADGTAAEISITPDPGTARAFRDVLGCFATGITIVTIAGADGPAGFTANSFSSLSMDPPLVLWSPAKASRRCAAFATAPYFSIHILGADQAGLPARFARDGAGFAGLDHHLTAEGTPAITGALARLDCAHHASHDGGDHLIVIGRVLRATRRTGAPLIFAQGRYGHFTPAA